MGILDVFKPKSNTQLRKELMALKVQIRKEKEKAAKKKKIRGLREDIMKLKYRKAIFLGKKAVESGKIIGSKFNKPSRRRSRQYGKAVLDFSI